MAAGTRPLRRASDAHRDGYKHFAVVHSAFVMPRDSSPAQTPKRPSCRLCRVRKVKCVKAYGAERCNSCIALDRECENPEARRRPGPVSRYAPAVRSVLTTGTRARQCPRPMRARHSVTSCRRRQSRGSRRRGARSRPYSRSTPTRPRRRARRGTRTSSSRSHGRTRGRHGRPLAEAWGASRGQTTWPRL